MAIHRRTFLATSAGVVSAATLGRVRLFGRQPQPNERPTFSSIRGNVGTMVGRGGTIGWLVTGGGTVVVDSQNPAMAAICLQFLAQTSKNQELKVVVNTHHHADHTAGNAAFKGNARQIVGHQNVPKLMARPDHGDGPAPVPPDTTFTNEWDTKVGHEEIELRHYGPAHTSGDAVVTFKKANVAHVGDLVFNGRHPILDRAAGGSLAGWINFLRRVVSDHTPETEYIFGHAGPGLPIRGRQADVTRMRDYLVALQAHVAGAIKSGRERAAIVKAGATLEGFEGYGPLDEPLLLAAYDEIAAG